MKIPFLPILKWIGTTLLAAAVQEGAERLATRRAKANADKDVSGSLATSGATGGSIIAPGDIFIDRLTTVAEPARDDASA